MQHTVGPSAGSAGWSLLRSGSPVPIGPVAIASFAIATVVSGCGFGGGVLAMPDPTSATAPADPSAHAHVNRPVLPHAAEESHLITVTGQQQAYLNALREAGLQPSEDLVALSIGSYVCQARAAQLGDQAVWDFVFPLVRNDVRDASTAHVAPRSAINAATAEYIRIASERLC